MQELLLMLAGLLMFTSGYAWYRRSGKGRDLHAAGSAILGGLGLFFVVEVAISILS